MSKALITESYLSDIGDAIRGKLGTEDLYTPPQMAEAIESIPTRGGILANWDFKTGLTDSVNGFVATLGGAASQGPDGITIADDTSYVGFPLDIKGIMRTYEIDVGAMTLQGSGHHRLIVSGGNGIIYRNTGKWAFYVGSWQEFSITDYAFFANSTVKIFIDAAAQWHIYKNGELVFEPDLPLPPVNSTVFRIGQDSLSLNMAKIEGFRVYY